MIESLDRRIAAAIKAQMPDAEVRLKDMTGGGDHWEIRVVAREFSGLSLIERHRRLHATLDALMAKDLHAVKFKTLTPEEASKT